jgi:hypothetical protein
MHLVGGFEKAACFNDGQEGSGEFDIHSAPIYIFNNIASLNSLFKTDQT